MLPFGLCFLTAYLSQIMDQINILMQSIFKGSLHTKLKHYFSVRVRYAPSPTGLMHIGGLRTALFNYLYAQKMKGQFILRIEDTDQARYVKQSLSNITQTLSWLGIEPHESPERGGNYGPYVQSQRMELYKGIEKELLKKNYAFPCFCVKGQSSRNYDGRCKQLTLPEIKHKITNGDKYAVRIRADLISIPEFFMDETYGRVSWTSFDDFVIVKSNGWPTYHFANVIDDWKMKISHVIRGEEWLTNTSKHIYLYKLLGAPIPKFAHLPLILSPTGKKLAKRDFSEGLAKLREKSFETEVLLNFISRLGWSDTHRKTQMEEALEKQPKKEYKLYTKQELTQMFSFQGVSKSPCRFDHSILQSLNKLNIKQNWKNRKDHPEFEQHLIEKVKQYIPSSKEWSDSKLLEFWECVIDRVKTVADCSTHTYFFEGPNYCDNPSSVKDFQKLYGAQAMLQQLEGGQLRMVNTSETLYSQNRTILENFSLIFKALIPQEEYNERFIAMRISQFLVSNQQIKNQQAYHFLRFILSGSCSGPSVPKLCVFIGREAVLEQVTRFLRAEVKQK